MPDLQNFRDFSHYYAYESSPKYVPFRYWYEQGLTERQAWDTCENGSWLLLLMSLRDWATDEDIQKCTTECVYRQRAYTPDCHEMLDAIKALVTTKDIKAKSSLKMAIVNEKLGVEAGVGKMEEIRNKKEERSLVEDDPEISEPIIPDTEEESVNEPGTTAIQRKAILALADTLDDPKHRATVSASLSARAKGVEARMALMEAIKEKAKNPSKENNEAVELLKDAEEKARKLERKIQADTIRNLVAGPPAE